MTGVQTCALPICLSGQATDIKIHSDHLINTRTKLNTLISEYTGQPYEKVCADTERDNYMTAEQAKQYGLVDAVMSSRE